MSIVVNDDIVSNDGNSKTYTYAELVTICMDMCGDEVTGPLRAKIIRWINPVLGEMFTDALPQWMLASSAFDTVAEYATGLATLTKGSKTVTFSGAVIDTSHVGRKLLRGGDNTGYVIASRVSATEVTIAHAYQEETVTSVEFKIIEDTYTLATAFNVARVVDQHFSNLHMDVVEDLNPEFKIGKPVICKFTLDKNIVVYPCPDRIMKVSYDFFRDFSQLTDVTATTSIPDQHVSVLSFGVARNYWLSKSQAQGSAKKAEHFVALFEKGKEEIVKYKYMDDSKLVSFIPYRVAGAVLVDGQDWGPERLLG